MAAMSTIDTFVEDCERILYGAPEVRGVPYPRYKSLWRNRANGRRGTISWVSQEQVCLEWREGETSLYELKDFIRLYREV